MPSSFKRFQQYANSYNGADDNAYSAASHSDDTHFLRYSDAYRSDTEDTHHEIESLRSRLALNGKILAHLHFKNMTETSTPYIRMLERQQASLQYQLHSLLESAGMNLDR
jgi:hypothetical protein